MGIYVKNMKMPKDGECVVITSDGTAYKYECGDVVMFGNCYIGMATSIEIPPHGRLIDADAFLARNAYFADREFMNPKYDDTLKDLLDRAKTIVSAEGE